MDRSRPLTSTPAATASAPRTADVLGIPLALTDYEGVLDWIDEAAAGRRSGYLCVAATHTVMASQDDPDLRAAVLGADFTVPDGQPLVWALNLLGHRLGDRVYGPELMDRACARAVRTGRRMYLYGGRTQGALVQLARNLRLRHPGLQIVGGHVPPFRELTAEEEAAAAPTSGARAPRSCGSGSACRSRRSGWRGCRRAWDRRC